MEEFGLDLCVYGTEYVPRYTHTIATATITKMSWPSSRKASHNRSCVWNGTELANSVIYHFVAYDVVEIMCFLNAAYTSGIICSVIRSWT